MKKYLKEKPIPKKINNQNKLKKVLYPSNSKPITLETNAYQNNKKLSKKKVNKQNKKIKNDTTSPSSRKVQTNKNTKNTHLTNKSLNNNTFLELDYLNFSKIDLGFRKLNSSFDEDIFGSNIFKEEKNKLVSNRYNEVDSSIDTIKTNSNNNYIQESKENLLKTPSTLCNYYDVSEAATSKKKVNDENNNNNSNNKNELRKNLDKLYENSKSNDIKYISVNTKNQNIVNWRLKDSIKITKNKSSTTNLKEKEKEKKENDFPKNNEQKEINKQLKQNNSKNNSKNKQILNQNNKIIKYEIQFKNILMENYLNSKIKKRKRSFNMSSSKKNNDINVPSIQKEFIAKTLKYTNNSSTKSIHIQNNTIGMNNHTLKNNNPNNSKSKNSIINVNFNKTITGVLMNTNNSNMSNRGNNIGNQKTNNTTNGIYYNSIKKGTNYKKGKHSGQQKPIILCYDQMKYESYFVTPKNTNKITKGKVQTSNKSTKFDSNSGGAEGGIGNTKKNSNNINNNNYNIFVNTLSKTKNKSFNKNNIYHNYNSTNNKLAKNNNYINNNKYEKAKVNLKNKSSSLLVKKQNGITYKNIDSNSNINNILRILNSGGKENSQLLENLLKKVNNSNTKSPLKKYKSSNALKISKTLTEENILYRMQVTPKYYKIPKGGNAYTTLAKKNKFINSNEKAGTQNLKNIKYNNSSIKKNCQIMRSNNNYKDILNNLFKHKTQSDFKTNKYYILNSSNVNSNNTKSNNNNEKKYLNNENDNDYGMDKHVKQKLLDRMNNASNSWQYIFRGNNNKGNNNNDNKKVLIENLSEIMKSPDKKDFINNNTIISNESEEEIEKKESNEKLNKN